MLKFWAVIVFLIVLTILHACRAPVNHNQKEKETFSHLNRENPLKINHMEEVKSVARSNDQFSMKLYDLLKNKEGNLIMSPFSVSAVMAMVSVGARGDTLKQITEGFSFPNTSPLQLGYQDTLPALKSTDNFILETANTAFIMEGYSVLPSFQYTLEKSFYTKFQSVNFGNSGIAASIINNWVEEITRDKIKDLIRPDMFNALTRLVLVNAIYFKGDWATKFDPKMTRDKDFYVSPSTRVKVPMMMQVRDFQWANLQSLSSTMVELPYKGGRIVMQVLLPWERNGLGKLEQMLKTKNIQKLFERESSETKVNIQLPKFRLEQDMDLKQNLISLGMSDMFSSADFSGINGKRNLYVSDVVQKAFIEVNEEGSEAAAATGVVFMLRSGGRQSRSRDFVADHPFIFYLRDKTTGMLLFQGRIVNP